MRLLRVNLLLAVIAAALLWATLGRGVQPSERALCVLLAFFALQVPLIAWGVWRRVRDRTAPEAVWALLPLTLLPWVGGLALPAIAAALPGRPEGPTVSAALRAAWTRYAARRRAGGLDVRRDLAFGPMPFLLAAAAAMAFSLVVSLVSGLAATLPVLGRLSLPGRTAGLVAGPLVPPVLAAVLLAAFGLACAFASVAAYPRAVLGHTRVLAALGEQLPRPSVGSRRLALGLLALDLLVGLALLGGPLLLLVLLTLGKNRLVPIFVVVHAVPPLLIAALGAAAALRFHVREVIVLGAERPVRDTLRLLRDHPGELARRTGVQLLLLGTTVALGALVLPVASLPALVGLAALSAAHAAGGSVVLDALVAVLVLGGLLALTCGATWLAGWVLAPFTLVQALYRLEYVRALLPQPPAPATDVVVRLDVPPGPDADPPPAVKVTLRDPLRPPDEPASGRSAVPPPR